MKWRKWNNVLHRDIGYLSVGLTLIYAVSGVAVNHTQDWNPNFVVKRTSRTVPQLREINPFAKSVVEEVTKVLAISDSVRATFRPDSAKMQIFFPNRSILVDFSNGTCITESVTSRRILRPMNFLHLNHAKRWWTYMADLYAICLGFLAVSGMFVLKGKKGLLGRGKWFVLAGVAVPFLFLFFYY